MNLRVVLAISAFLALTCLLHCRPHSPINRQNFERIKLGMTQKEVENVLGPSGDYSSGPLTVDISADEIWGEWKATPEDFAEGMLKSHRWFFKFFHGWYAREWASNNGIIQVAFDGSGKVEQKEFIDVRSRYENPFDRLRRCLRREERQVTIPVRVVSGGIGP